VHGKRSLHQRTGRPKLGLSFSELHIPDSRPSKGSTAAVTFIRARFLLYVNEAAIKYEMTDTILGLPGKPEKY